MNTIIQIGLMLKAVESVQGRKKLQKMVHILQEFGVPFGVNYGYHHYGPFSDELQDLIQIYQRDKLVKETPVAQGPYPSSKFEAEERLFGLLDAMSETGIPEWAGFARELNGKTAKDLEAISTLIYLEKSGVSSEMLQSAFKDLKPQLADRMDAALTTINEWRSKYGDKILAA